VRNCYSYCDRVDYVATGPGDRYRVGSESGVFGGRDGKRH